MNTDRAMIKSAAVALLDALGEEHALKHQDSKARRYTLTASGGTPLEVMFQRDPESPPNLWVLGSVAGALIGGAIPQKPSPVSKLRTEVGKDGRPVYGRHSALEKMPQLGEADLICFAPTNFAELGEILDQLLAASAVGGV